MPKQNLLTNLKVSKAACPSDKKYEWHQDGNGLLLRVDRQKNKTWTSRLFNKGKETKRGIGSYPTISLQSAREINLEFKKQWAKGIDPSVEKKKAFFFSTDGSIPFAHCFLNSRLISLADCKEIVGYEPMPLLVSLPLLNNLDVQVLFFCLSTLNSKPLPS